MHFVTSEPQVGHLGLNGVGGNKSMMESEPRDRHIRRTCNAKIASVEDGHENKEHELAFKHSMILPAFKGVDVVIDVEGLTNPRGG
jgi:sulfide:quinone oxidoreductase